jgi:catechol 2,3-dioxygenase-like lactoylglutathione lyase family enzyme
VIDTPPLLPPGSTFHHIGLACRDLARELEGLVGLGYRAVGEEFTDPTQGVIGLFLEGLGPRIELLAPSGGSRVLDPWLAGRAKMYHLAYEVPELSEALEAAAGAGARRVSEPVPAVAFGGREICFVMLRNLFLVELIQGPAAA